MRGQTKMFRVAKTDLNGPMWLVFIRGGAPGIGLRVPHDPAERLTGRRENTVQIAIGPLVLFAWA